MANRPCPWLLLAVLLAAVGCSEAFDTPNDPLGPSFSSPMVLGQRTACAHASPRAPWTGEECYDPVIDPQDFNGVAEDNPYFPLVPGTVFYYEKETEDGLETSVVTVSYDTKTILGVQTTVVYDIERLDGVLEEVTEDWYAQDVHGNVWYFGEFTVDADGSTEGSWEAGQPVNGDGDLAKPGIIMLANPRIGQTYRQEYAPGVAEDMGRVVRLNAAVSVPYDDFTGCLVTQDWNALEKANQEFKTYCPGIGLVQERERNERLVLVDIEQP